MTPLSFSISPLRQAILALSVILHRRVFKLIPSNGTIPVTKSEFFFFWFVSLNFILLYEYLICFIFLLWVCSDLVIASAGDDKKITLWQKNGQSMGTIPLTGSESGDNVEVIILFLLISFWFNFWNFSKIWGVGGWLIVCVLEVRLILRRILCFN